MTQPNRAARKTSDVTVTMPPWVASSVATVLEEAADRWFKQAEAEHRSRLDDGSLSTLRGLAQTIRDQSENGAG